MTHIVPSVPPSTHEIHAMARVLASRYGASAGEIAESFVFEHETVGDHARATLWGEVCAQLERISGTEPQQALAPPTLS